MKKKELLEITVRLLTEENERLRKDVAYWKHKANKEFNDKFEVVDEALEGYGGGVVKSNPNITRKRSVFGNSEYVVHNSVLAKWEAKVLIPEFTEIVNKSDIQRLIDFCKKNLESFSHLEYSISSSKECEVLDFILNIESEKVSFDEYLIKELMKDIHIVYTVKKLVKL